MCSNLKFKYTAGGDCDWRSKLLAVSPSLHKITNIYVTFAFLCIIFLLDRTTFLPLMIWNKLFSIYRLSTKFPKPLFLLVLSFSVRLHDATTQVQQRQKTETVSIFQNPACLLRPLLELLVALTNSKPNSSNTTWTLGNTPLPHTDVYQHNLLRCYS